VQTVLLPTFGIPAEDAFGIKAPSHRY